MALSQSSLSSAIESLLASLPATASDAADAMAQAYYDYAANGQFAASAPSIPGANKSALSAILLGAISVPAAGSPSTFAAAWAAGVTAFWVSVPVTGPQTGATVGCPGAAGLTAPLTAVFSSLANTAATCASGMAAALHTATMTVTATVAPPPGTVLPIA